MSFVVSANTKDAANWKTRGVAFYRNAGYRLVLKYKIHGG